MNKSRFYVFVGVLIISLILVGSGLAAQNNQNLNSDPTGVPTLSSGSTELVAPPKSSNPDAVLWDQPLSTVNQNAYVNQNFSDVPDFSSYLADDFTVEGGWLIDSIFVPGNGWNGFTTLMNATNLTWSIYADNGGIPAGNPNGGDPPVWTFSAVPSDSRVLITTGSGGFPSNTLLTLDAANYATLPPGDYWLVFYPTLAFSGGGQFGRQPADTTNGGIAKFINPGGGFGYGTAWQDWSVIGATQHDIAFRLEGQLNLEGPYFGESYKSAPESITVGEPIPYTIHIINTGADPALDASMTDPIPLATNYNDDVTCTAGVCTYDAATDTILWSGEVEVGEDIEVTFSVTPNTGLCGETIVNEATITDPEAPDPVVVTASTYIAGPVITSEDFEADNGGYTSTGPQPWNWGVPPAGLAPAHSGVNVWATQSPYINSGLYQLVSAPIDLTAADPSRPLFLQWWQKLDVEVNYDYAFIDISTDGGSTWDNGVWEGNYHGSWEQKTLELTPYIGQEILLRFRLTTDSSVTYAGWAIDDVAVLSGCLPPDIAVDPTSLFEELVPDATATQELLVCNEGESTLHWTLKEVEPVRSGQGVHIPAVTTPVLSAGVSSIERAPNAGSPDASQPNLEGILGPLGSPAFAVEVYPAGNLVSFDTDTPGAWTVVAPLAGNTFFGGDFLYGDFSTLYVVDYDSNTLRTVDTATGAVTVIGPAVPSGGESWTGLTGAPDGTLYGSATTCASSTLYTVDPATGTTTPIGPVSNAPCLIDIAMNGEGALYGVDIVGNNLIQIDPATGAGTIIGNLGVDPNFAQGLDFEEVSGVLYWASYTTSGALRVIDITTGASTLVGAFPGGAEVDSLAFATGGAPPFDTPWLSEDPLEGDVFAGECSVVDVTFDSTGLTAGTYDALLQINSNDPDENPVMVPVELKVGLPNIVVDTTLEMTMNPNEVGILPFTIGNTGDIDLDWSAAVTGSWLSVDPTSGTVNEGTTATVDAIFNTAGLAPGVYHGTITITSNDPDGSPVEIAVTLTVNPFKFFIPFIAK